MDVLSDVMQAVRIRTHIYGRWEVTAPWGIQFPAARVAGFRVVSRGHCWLEMDGISKPVALAAGDFVLLPRGRAYVLRDAPNTIPVQWTEAVRHFDRESHTLRMGGGGVPASLISGTFLFHEVGSNPLVDSLPPIIHIKADEGATVQWLAPILQFVMAEMSSKRPGAELVGDCLAKILFVQAVRAYIADERAQPSGWLKALADPQVGRALRLMHESVQRRWTVESLAEAVAMSRSAFAVKFSAAVGESPLRYLTAWRMRRASQMLLDGEKIAAIAHAVGYDTQAAFGKAFKRYAGATPGEFRRKAEEAVCPKESESSRKLSG